MIFVFFYPASTGRAGMCSYLAENKVPAFSQTGLRARWLHILRSGAADTGVTRKTFHWNTKKSQTNISLKPLFYIFKFQIYATLVPLSGKAQNKNWNRRQRLEKKTQKKKTPKPKRFSRLESLKRLNTNMLLWRSLYWLFSQSSFDPTDYIWKSLGDQSNRSHSNVNVRGRTEPPTDTLSPHAEK